MLVDKVPSDGLCGKSDEDNLGFTYDVLDKYIRTGEIEDPTIKEKIDALHEKNLFKLQPMPSFSYDGSHTDTSKKTKSMKKFKVTQDADYMVGYLRCGHREGIIEAESIEDALYKLQNKGYTDYLDFKVDSCEVEDAVSYTHLDVYKRQLEFGRSPFRALGTFYDKWLYACASLVLEYNDDKYKELEALALKYVPGLKKIVMPMILDSVPNKDFPGNKNSDYVQKYGKTEDEFNEWLDQKEVAWGIDTIEYLENDRGYFCFERPYVCLLYTSRCV